ncbi:peptidylprolyl isomerase [Nitrospirillum sp. BR 11828]|uniref:peptidylprolyl isomerase n=1 Tax=Nitrospirillum sp. BR 11828 TaxID=3104325 RepID=UPI002ACA66FA|nr:peptidylprolyl isomerase [Nitrospirillum sp. BR 11828]MDZ5649341.1 peptidylprolyl isomerase [Nitrospirillum sp. BR 11828]
MRRPMVAARLAAALVCLSVTAHAADAAKPATPKPAGKAGPVAADVLAAASPMDWRSPNPENLLYMDLAQGRVIIELAPAFAPAHVDNIRKLVREGWFDGLAVDRVQDNYVTQWGDADNTRTPKTAQTKLAPEFVVRGEAVAKLPFTPLPDRDTYAPEAGYSDGFPAARDAKGREAWLVHCYGMVGVGRDMALDSGSGAELYAVIGQAPRHLDRNITVVGRVLRGMDILSSLPRGTAALGFYDKPEQRIPITKVRLAADLPPDQRDNLVVLRTDTPTWAAYVEARRNRREDFFPVPAGHVDVCNIPIPVRTAEAKPIQ